MNRRLIEERLKRRWRFKGRQRPAFERAQRNGYLTARREQHELRQRWCVWCVALDLPLVIVETRGPVAEVIFDVYIMDGCGLTAKGRLLVWAAFEVAGSRRYGLARYAGHCVLPRTKADAVARVILAAVELSKVRE